MKPKAGQISEKVGGLALESMRTREAIIDRHEDDWLIQLDRAIHDCITWVKRAVSRFKPSFDEDINTAKVQMSSKRTYPQKYTG